MNGTYSFVKKELLTKHEVMAKFPKVELHRHLEGSFDLSVLHSIALRNKLDIPRDFTEFKSLVQFPKDSGPDFLKFLSKFRTDWYRSYADVYDISYASIKNLVNDGIFYIELRFNPEHFALYNNFDRKEVTKIVIEAGNKAASETKINLRYLVTFNRMKQTQAEMIGLYQDLRSLGYSEIVGIDLAGDELNFPPEMFTEFFDYVNDDGKYMITIHAGEVTPSSQIWTAIDKLHAKRIGHGTSTISDGALQKELISRKIALEQCITSNFQTGSWEDEPNHPLGRLYRLGVPVTINSDDPHIQDADLTDDYIKTVKYFDFTVDDLQAINHTAIDSSFVDASIKETLREEYDKRVKRFVLNLPRS